MINEEKIELFADELASHNEYDENLKLELALDDKHKIEATQRVIEEEECVYNLSIINTESNEIIDSIYSEIDSDIIYEIIMFLMEEYIEE